MPWTKSIFSVLYWQLKQTYCLEWPLQRTLMIFYIWTNLGLYLTLWFIWWHMTVQLICIRDDSYTQSQISFSNAKYMVVGRNGIPEKEIYIVTRIDYIAMLTSLFLDLFVSYPNHLTNHPSKSDSKTLTTGNFHN